MTELSPRPTRRPLLAAGTALPLFAIPTRPASAAGFNRKLATGQEQDLTHPVSNGEEAWSIPEKSTGKLA